MNQMVGDNHHDEEREVHEYIFVGTKVLSCVFGFLVIEGSKEGGREQRLSHDSMTTNTFNDASDELNKVSTDEPISTLISQKANQMLKRCGLVSYTHIRTNCLTNRRKESKSIRLDHQNDDFDRRCFVSTWLENRCGPIRQVNLPSVCLLFRIFNIPHPTQVFIVHLTVFFPNYYRTSSQKKSTLNFLQVFWNAFSTDKGRFLVESFVFKFMAILSTSHVPLPNETRERN